MTEFTFVAEFAMTLCKVLARSTETQSLIFRHGHSDAYLCIVVMLSCEMRLNR